MVPLLFRVRRAGAALWLVGSTLLAYFAISLLITTLTGNGSSSGNLLVCVFGLFLLALSVAVVIVGVLAWPMLLASQAASNSEGKLCQSNEQRS